MLQEEGKWEKLQILTTETGTVLNAFDIFLPFVGGVPKTYSIHEQSQV